jgi:hypothetical protein
MPRDKKQFVLYERQGWSEREALEADSIEEMMEKMAEKTGRDDGWFS